MTTALAELPIEKLTPTLAKLGTRERAFVEHMMTATTHMRAAILAGYGQSSPTVEKRDQAARQAAWRLMKDPEIIEALREQAALTLRSSALLGAKVLAEIANDPLHKDRLKAAKELLMHSGFLQVHEQRITVDDRRLTDQETLDKAVALAQRMGLDPKRLLGSMAPAISGPVVDVDFTTVIEPTQAGDEWSWQPD